MWKVHTKLFNLYILKQKLIIMLLKFYYCITYETYKQHFLQNSKKEHFVQTFQTTIKIK